MAVCCRDTAGSGALTLQLCANHTIRGAHCGNNAKGPAPQTHPSGRCPVPALLLVPLQSRGRSLGSHPVAPLAPPCCSETPRAVCPKEGVAPLVTGTQASPWLTKAALFLGNAHHPNTSPTPPHPHRAQLLLLLLLLLCINSAPPHPPHPFFHFSLYFL